VTSRVGRLRGAACLLAVACTGRDQPPAADSIATTPDSATAPQIALPLRVLGTEPFWALDIDSTGLRFITPEDTSGIRFPPLQPTVAGDTTAWVGQTEGASIEARLWREKCSDGMSDREYPYSATVHMKGTSYRGCADKRP